GKPRDSGILRAPRMPSSPANTRDHAIVYSGSRLTALSQPAFEQCPLLGCAPTGPLRPSIGAHMKRPSHLHLRSGIQPRTRLRPPRLVSPALNGSKVSLAGGPRAANSSAR